MLGDLLLGDLLLADHPSRPEKTDQISSDGAHSNLRTPPSIIDRSEVMGLGDLSEHFSKAELACHCCGTLKIEAALIDALELFRSLAGRPVVVHDAYRCPVHNQKVGGVNDSEHTRGMAADAIFVSGKP